jgi:hypothetical protein
MNKLILTILLNLIMFNLFATKSVEVMYTNGTKDTIETKSRPLYLSQGDLHDNRGHVYRSFVVGFNVIGETKDLIDDDSPSEHFWRDYKYWVLCLLLLLLILGYFHVKKRVREAINVV